MVAEVLDTQRDFKNILLQLVNSTTRDTTIGVKDISVEETPPLANVAEATLPIGNESIPVSDDPVPGAAASPQPSWMSADTVLLTPNTRNSFRPSHHGRADLVAVSADVSNQSIANGSVNDSVGVPLSAAEESPTVVPTSDSGVKHMNNAIARGPPPVLLDPHCKNVTFETLASRERSTTVSMESLPVAPSPSRTLKFPPRIGSDVIAVNKPSYICHLDMGNDAVVEGRTGGSWKAKSQKLGTLCQQGEQMVQIHKVLVPHVPLLHLESRQPFQCLEEAIAKSTGSNVFIKWDCKYIHKKSF
ncbi:hypothetical protein KC19_VG152500 [Ceratodon purpureus]|uniref:Uncharacterized protein n=1 Tax=Ceratodon purpureus TaxID=3225 RepID=A0A8T0HRH3_CERPU|nr:hypothetical protein KC19_VG152500 [Ceratodon purpureus]